MATGELRSRAELRSSRSTWATATTRRRLELRMGMKVLKDAGVLPPEVLAMREAAELESQLAACTDPTQRRALQQQLADKRQAIALRLEKLAASRSW
jgi:hypothetical protein